jgi:hypothetical protein
VDFGDGGFFDLESRFLALGHHGQEKGSDRN